MKHKTFAEHEREVARLCRELQSRHRLKAALPKALSTAAPSHQTRKTSYKRGEPLLNLDRFHSVIEIDCENKIALVEPRVTMEELTGVLLAHRLMPPVVCEFKEITVGGAVMGAGLESSSHIHRQFNDCCAWIEVVLADGEHLRISPNAHPDLFYALPGSYGTLCWITLVAIRLIPARSYVHLTYHHFSDRKSAVSALLQERDTLFLDGVSFGPDSHLVIQGEPTDAADAPLVTFGHRTAPWFVQHLANRSHGEEYISMRDYLFRFDRAAFWMGQHMLGLGPLLAYFTRSKRGWTKPKPKPPRYPGPLFRALFGHLFSSKKLYAALHRIPFPLFEETFVVQDCVLPATGANLFLEEIETAYQIYPLWLCPLKAAGEAQPFSPHYLPNSTDPLLLNVGIYGVPNFEAGAIAATRDLEQRTTHHGGRKGLYSQSYYSPEAFWQIYDRNAYQELRKTYRAERLNSLEEKLLR